MSTAADADRTQQELIEYIAGFTHDPLGFVIAAFPWGQVGTPLEKHKGPRKWQREVLNEIGEHLRNGHSLTQSLQPYLSAVASGHGIGKSALVSFVTLWALSTCQNTRGVVTANTEAQLRTKTWPEISKWFNMMLCAHWFEAEAMSIHARGPMPVQKAWRIDAIPWSENNTEAFAGLHNEGARLLLIFDEASSIADKVWEVSEGALTDADTEILWLVFGNPTRNSGRFRECFRKNGHRWHQRQIDSRTVEGLNLAQLQKIVDDNGEESDLVKVRIRGMFPASSAMQFIATTDVDAAFGRVIRPESYNFAPVILTCDPSWTGEDPLIIGLRQGNMFKVLREMPKNDDDVQVATILAMLQDEHKADAVFIDFGYGTGIYSAGMAMGRLGWQMVQFGAAAPNPGFVNMRAWIWDQMKQWLKQGGSIQPHHGLYTELCGPETISRLDGRIQLESKQDMKDRGLPSPNCFVAGTMVSAARGLVPIERVFIGDMVETPVGFRRVVFCHHLKSSELTTATFSNGTQLVGTPNHRCFTWDKGWVRMDALAMANEMETVGEWSKLLWILHGLLFTKDRNTGFKNMVDTTAPGERQTRSGCFTGESGGTLTAIFRRASRSITKTMTGWTALWKTWSAGPLVNTGQLTCESAWPSRGIASGLPHGESRPSRRPPSGIDRQRESHGTKSTARMCGRPGSLQGSSASGAASDSNHSSHGRSSVEQPANNEGTTSKTRRLLQRAKSAAGRLCAIATRSSRVAPVSVQTCDVEETPVYSLTLDRDNVYYANGILVENCADALAISFAFPVSKLATVRTTVAQQAVVASTASYDPLRRRR